MVFSLYGLLMLSVPYGLCVSLIDGLRSRIVRGGFCVVFVSWFFLVFVCVVFSLRVVVVLLCACSVLVCFCVVALRSWACCVDSFVVNFF